MFIKYRIVLMGRKSISSRMGRENRTILDSYVIRKYNLLGKSGIITLVRDPVERSLSGFFYNLRNERSEKLQDLSEHPDVLLETFINNGPDNYTLQWFDNEFRKTTKLDIYRYDFDKDIGYTVINDKGFNVLLLKVETNNEIKRKALTEFLGCEGITLETKNTSAKWNYYEVYNKFKNEVKFPIKYLNKMYKSKLATHFYSDDEIRAFYKIWG